MRVLMLNYEFPPLGGGAGNATYQISRELVKKGCDVDILTSIWEGHEPFEHVEGIRIFRVKSLRKDIFDCGLTGAWTYLFFARLRLAQLLKEHQYNIVHVFFSLPTGILTLMSKRLRRIPYIVSLRGSDVPGYDPFNRKVEHLHKLMKPIHRHILKKASRIVALSNGLRDMTLKAFPDLSLEVVYNGVEDSLFKPCGDTECSDTVRLITVSRLINRKGIQHLLEALSTLKDINFSLKIVGTGNYEETLKELSRRLELTDKVVFCGYKARNELPELYSSADLFVLPSLTESFGQVFVEAMACGLPVIGANIGGIPEIVEHNENGILIQPGDVNSLRDALLLLIKNTELRETMSKKNLFKVKKHFRWEAISQQYLDIYQKING